MALLCRSIDEAPAKGTSSGGRGAGCQDWDGCFVFHQRDEEGIGLHVAPVGSVAQPPPCVLDLCDRWLGPLTAYFGLSAHVTSSGVMETSRGDFRR